MKIYAFLLISLVSSTSSVFVAASDTAQEKLDFPPLYPQDYFWDKINIPGAVLDVSGALNDVVRRSESHNLGDGDMLYALHEKEDGSDIFVATHVDELGEINSAHFILGLPYEDEPKDKKGAVMATSCHVARQDQMQHVGLLNKVAEELKKHSYTELVTDAARVQNHPMFDATPFQRRGFVNQEFNDWSRALFYISHYCSNLKCYERNCDKHN